MTALSILDHPGIFAPTVFVLLLAAVEVGHRMAVISGPAFGEDRREQIASARSALGILLSLLLGFSLAMALPRYDARRNLVIEEANAISATSLRAQMLPQPYRDRLAALVQQYVAARLAYSRIGSHSTADGELVAAIERTKSLQAQMWAQAEALSMQSPPPSFALFVNSLTEMMGLSERRISALENRIPFPVWIMLILIALLTCVIVGYEQRRRFWLIALVTPLMASIVMGLVADLDSSRTGFLRVDLRSLERLGAALTANLHQVAGIRLLSRCNLQ
jgi:hypothetical protein